MYTIRPQKQTRFLEIHSLTSAFTYRLLPAMNIVVQLHHYTSVFPYVILIQLEAVKAYKSLEISNVFKKNMNET